MIGQKNLINEISELVYEDRFPRFCLIVGSSGSGKKTIADFIGKALNSEIIFSPGNRISDLRDLIDLSHHLTGKTTFIISDIDGMSLGAKNSMLKVLEEAPNQSYWIMTAVNVENVLPTIVSRATVFNIESYSQEELNEYAKQFGDIDISICNTPGEVQELARINNEEFLNFVDLVLDNIEKVSGSNSFKLAEKLKLKKDGQGYDLNLFWNAFKSRCLERLKNNLLDYDQVYKWSNGITITTEFQNELGIQGINKASLVDDWILTIRKVWM